MKTRGSTAVASGPEPTTSRNLRPRQATSTRGQSAGSIPPTTGGRATRSSAMLASTIPTNAVPQPTSHKHSSPVEWSEVRSSKRTRHAHHEPVASAAQDDDETQGRRMTRSSAMRASTSATKSPKRGASQAWPQGRTSKRSCNALLNPGFYAENDSETGDESELSEGDNDSDSSGSNQSGDEPANPYISPGPEVEPKANNITPKKQRTTKKASPRKASASSRTKKIPEPVATDVTGEEQNANKDTIIPHWASLPHHILVPILRYASAPLDELRRVKWLVDTGLLCKAFMDAAIDALYESPPLLSRPMAHRLVSLLSKDPATTRYNYRPKVKELWLDVEDIASKTFKGQHLDLKALISSTPQLKTLRFFHQKDFAPYRSLDDSLRWHYPESLFEALGAKGREGQEGEEGQPEGSGPTIRLKDWQWNRRMMGREFDLVKIEKLHHTPPFERLTQVSFVNYQVPSLDAKDSEDQDEVAAKDQAYVQALARAINALPDLVHLSLESSTAANDLLLPLLPKNLKTLQLINCWEVTGDTLATFLLSSGQELERLILHHNQSLDLSFLTILGSACPKLRVLSVDCKTFKHHEFYHDSEPSYDELLSSDQTPDWPASLEALQLLNMRKWSETAAEKLFQSLVDSAPNLPCLRLIELKAMLDIPIHERSRMRNRWDRTMRKVFLRDKGEPKPLFSLRPPAAVDNSAAAAAGAKSKKPKSRDQGNDNEQPERRSVRLAMKWSAPSSRASSPVRELRNGMVRPSYVEPDTSDDQFDEDSDNEDGNERSHGIGDADNGGGEDAAPASPDSAAAAAGPKLFRHGLCERVEIQLDNQKVAERTLTMDDFLDSEDDDLEDEDWDGDDEDFDTGYAW
ncbi:hypothetical protein VTJ04DRAFT_8979 [Mycothermus thermophilus]|uniref:uncharacterized protein n=1 Tax=Humicola insolens TaxID=85995 RepID=UPI003742FE56